MWDTLTLELLVVVWLNAIAKAGPPIPRGRWHRAAKPSLSPLEQGQGSG